MATERCPLCDDDGWVEQWVGEPGQEMPIAADCPRLDEPSHAPFNATGILDDTASRAVVRGSNDE
jgi:hypothetical protein